jgi:hypothetical protein
VLISLLKNLKQVGVSQIVSATLVVQGVAVQQSAVQDFEAQEAIVQALEVQSKSERSLSESSNSDQEKYWSDAFEVIETAEVSKSKAVPEVSRVAEAFEEIVSEAASSSSQSQVPSGGNLIAGVSVSPSISPSPGNSNPVPSVAPPSNSSSGRAPSAAAGGVNGLNSQPAVEESSDSQSNEVSPSVETTTPEVVASSASDTTDDPIVEEEAEEEEEVVIAEPTPTPEPVNEYETYLEEVNFYRDNVLVQELTDGDSITVEESSDFEIQIEEQDDFGSMKFVLTNTDTNTVIKERHELSPLYQINSGNGISLEEGNYSLLLQVFADDQGVNPEAERTITFSIANPEPSGPLDGNLALYKNGAFEAYVNDGDTLYLNSGDNYNLRVEAESDFGSVNFDLEATNANSSGGGQQNHMTFDLTDSNNGFDFVTANYDLTLIAYPSNGQGETPLQTLSINFDVVVQ